MELTCVTQPALHTYLSTFPSRLQHQGLLLHCYSQVLNLSYGALLPQRLHHLQLLPSPLSSWLSHPELPTLPPLHSSALLWSLPSCCPVKGQPLELPREQNHQHGGYRKLNSQTPARITLYKSFPCKEYPTAVGISKRLKRIGPVPPQQRNTT